MKRIALFALAALVAAPAHGNDSTAEAAVGGLVLTQNSDIDMVSEDLFVSAEQVRVRYVFRNRSPRDVRVTVAFPMPDRDFAELRYSDAAFPAGRDLVVEHRYTPAVGGTVATGLTHPEFREGEGMREMAARYCIDSDFLAAVDRAVARTGEERPTFDEQWIGYILTTGGNWRGPIGDFRLVVDKGDPDYLVSFCGEGVRRISPTQFEMRRRNWRPDRDLDILILRPWGTD